MRLTLGVDALVPPLTGIGRYTFELAKHYQLHRSQLAVRFFFAGRWVSDPAALLQEPVCRKPGQLRKLWERNRLRKWQTARELRRGVYHSPNYFLPSAVEGGVVTVHDLSVFKYPETHPIERIRHFEAGFASTLKRAAHLITDSEAIREEVVEQFGWPAEKVTAISLGVPSVFHPRDDAELRPMLAALGLEPGAYVLCVSTLEPRKRIDALLTAYRALPDSLRQRYPLVLAGSNGWLSESLLAQIQEGESQGWVRYLGFVAEPILPFLYSGAHAFLFPSVYEGFGLPVLEAMASGVPTLTSDCSSLPEVADGAAWLVQPGDHQGLYDGIIRVLCDEIWRKGARDRGLEVAARHTWERCAERTLDVCRRFM
ncbi:TPA: glycosyltransferase family 4 protein [Burkholderia aenigmatica]|uniref:glycosyltransferase family 4 protein n=1 Tax=Burkholderia sp. AU45251 TaxID=3059204 RepID=UPI00264E6BB9|nr:glycosyltransferase family 1 protein [Burkholderia sp. AU45251]HDR9488010.1 glycosyltransferase family 4 protein [Burkholderia aenigmatica]MDN7521160.1 glycosyltransferase family 1 protein [Burkholderia sp. AU45251]HDR9519727.1 glycosyltransferase family 4 protein [Burkholderia aenigmatica]HDR9596757.1 glycosyltransferase family 4 protein [Burkholderia aenigmatica]HDR9604154.1 glycosyltransferase family 4 protein [Burkholderia aenigmatica]